MLPCLFITEYTLVGIIPTSRTCQEYCSSFGQQVRVYLGCTTQVNYDVGVLPHDYLGSLMGRSVDSRMGWDNPMWFQVEIELIDEISGSRCAPLRVWISYCLIWHCIRIAPTWYSGLRCAPRCGYRLRCAPCWYALWWRLIMIFWVEARWQRFQVAAWWI